MKAVFITYNEALGEPILTALEKSHLRGYTKWETVSGRGSHTGEPHLGSHAWPTMNSASMVIASDEQAAELKRRLLDMDAAKPALGLRVFTWTIDD